MFLSLRRRAFSSQRRAHKHRPLSLQELPKVLGFAFSGKFVLQARDISRRFISFYLLAQFCIIKCLKFESSEDKLMSYTDCDTDSGGTPIHKFCKICGSNIMSINESRDWVKGHVIVALGCLDDARFAQLKSSTVNQDVCSSGFYHRPRNIRL